MPSSTSLLPHPLPPLPSAQLKALAIVRQKGALEKKQETSGGNRTPLTPSQQEAVKKRVEESSGSQSDGTVPLTSCSLSHTLYHSLSLELLSDSDEEEGTKSLHLDPTYIEQIMNAKSSHDWAVKEVRISNRKPNHEIARTVHEKCICHSSPFPLPLPLPLPFQRFLSSMSCQRR